MAKNTYYYTRNTTNTEIRHSSLESRMRVIYAPGRQKKGNERAKSEDNKLKKRKTGK